MSKLVWILGGAGVLGVLALTSKKAVPAPLPTPGPQPMPGGGGGGAPIVPKGGTFPPGTATARVVTKDPTSHLNVRQGPSENTAILARVSNGDLVAVDEAQAPAPPTPAAPKGWEKITTSNGVHGYVRLDFLAFGAPQVAGWSPWLPPPMPYGAPGGWHA